MARFSHQAVPKRLLVRGVNWLGDAVMTLPALARLREHLKQTEISLLVQSKLEPLFRNHASLDRVLTLAPGQTMLQTARHLRQFGFDSALILPNSFRSALEPLFARIPERIGMDGHGRRLLLTSAVPKRSCHARMRKLHPREVNRRISAGARTPDRYDASSHQSLDYLHLVARAFGCSQEAASPTISVPREEIDGALLKFGLSTNEVLIGLNPGAEYGPAKRWPADKFIATAQRIASGWAGRFVVFGLQTDAPLCESIARSINAATGGRAVSLAGRTSLRELMALLSGCKLVLTNDSGPMHLAAALGTSVVALFGSTSPELTGPLPFGVQTVLRGSAPCAPCFLRECPIDFRCMHEITPDVAARAIARKLTVGTAPNRP